LHIKIILPDTALDIIRYPADAVFIDLTLCPEFRRGPIGNSDHFTGPSAGYFVLQGFGLMIRYSWLALSQEIQTKERQIIMFINLFFMQQLF